MAPILPLLKNWRFATSHPKEFIIGDISKGVITCSKLHDFCGHFTFISHIEPKNILEAEGDSYWLLAIKEELNQFERNQVWHLVPRPHDRPTICTKWIFRNKLDESGNDVRNKVRLVAQGYTQIESIDFEVTFAPVVRLEIIRITLAFASYKDFKRFQKDVKSAFLNGFIEEEVYVDQSPRFVDPTQSDFVFKLDKDLYDLKQVPRAWYERLLTFLISNSFVKSKIDTTLFTKLVDSNILIVQIYVDNIIFGSTNEKLCKDFESYMKNEFEMSMMSELNYFLGLQIKQKSDEIFINQAKYTRELIKKFGFEGAKTSKTLIATTTKLDKDE